MIKIDSFFDGYQIPKVDYEVYNESAKYLSYLLTPATVCLAIPLYEQFELLKKTTKDIYDYTKKNCGRKFLVKAPMISSICEKRLINSALNSDGSNTVFEIGGGSGTLGCVLLEDNHRYVATDVTQSFYILQSRMYEYISKNDICELVTDPLNTKSQCIHIPYWKLWELRYEQIPIDIVVSNHALLEMSQNSLRFYSAGF